MSRSLIFKISYTHDTLCKFSFHGDIWENEIVQINQHLASHKFGKRSAQINFRKDGDGYYSSSCHIGLTYEAADNGEDDVFVVVESALRHCGWFYQYQYPSILPLDTPSRKFVFRFDEKGILPHKLPVEI